MKCMHCGKEISNDARFCEYCGESLEIHANEQAICPNCGAPIDTDSMFCGNCGYGIETLASNAGDAKADNAPGTHDAHSDTNPPPPAKPKSKKKKIIIATALALACAISVVAVILINGRSCYVVSTLKVHMDVFENYDNSQYTYEYKYDDGGAVTENTYTYTLDGENTTETYKYETDDKGLHINVTDSYGDLNNIFDYTFSSNGSDQELPSGRTTKNSEGMEYDKQEYTYDSEGTLKRAYKSNGEAIQDGKVEEKFDEDGYPTYYKSEQADIVENYEFKRTEKDGDEILKMTGEQRLFEGNKNINISLRMEYDKNGNVSKVYASKSGSSEKLLAEATWEKVRDPYPFTKATSKAKFWEMNLKALSYSKSIAEI